MEKFESLSHVRRYQRSTRCCTVTRFGIRAPHDGYCLAAISGVQDNSPLQAPMAVENGRNRSRGDTIFHGQTKGSGTFFGFEVGLAAIGNWPNNEPDPNA